MSSIKAKLKRYDQIYRLNASIKSMLLKVRLWRLRRHYNSNKKTALTRHCTIESLKEFHFHQSISNPLFRALPKGNLRIFWIGASEAQDRSGFLQALEHFGEVSCFINRTGTYGPQFNIDGLNWLQVRERNDIDLIGRFKTFNHLQKVDLVIGQMWAHVFSEEALVHIRSHGVPVVNIAMDDKLPEIWGWRNGIRLGSVGLGKGVDVTLTTTKEACAWYKQENMTALFFPLASDYKLFAPCNDLRRDIDVLFIGNCYGIRKDIIRYLAKHGVNVDCYGDGWPNGFVDAQKNIELSRRARIILGVGTVG